MDRNVPSWQCSVAGHGAHALPCSSLGTLTRIAWEAKTNVSYQTTPSSDAGTVGGVGACSLFKKLPQGFRCSLQQRTGKGRYSRRGEPIPEIQASVASQRLSLAIIHAHWSFETTFKKPSPTKERAAESTVQMVRRDVCTCLLSAGTARILPSHKALPSTQLKPG